MFWEEETKQSAPHVVDDIVDVSFAIRCKALPVDNGHLLWQQIKATLPWLEDTSGAALHSIHVAESGNGWQRPETLLYPSRRTRLTIRVPREREQDTRALCGVQLDIGGYGLEILDCMGSRPLCTLGTLFSRYVVCDDETEADFLQRIAATLRTMGIRPRKMMCGREHRLETGTGAVPTRSLMIADLETEEALILQRQGLGQHQHMGCGIFIPHKGIKEVGSADQHE